MRISITSIFIILTFNGLFSQESQNSVSKMALAYMDAYSDWNVEKMKAFYTDSIHFADPTAVETFQNNFDLVGKDKVAELFKSIFPDALPKYVDFKIKEYFVSGSYAVMNSNFQLVLPRNWYGEKAEGKIFVSVPMVTILKFKGDKITSHQDFVDYNSYQQQINHQLKESQ